MIIPSFFAADVHTHIINSSSITSQVKTQQAFWPMFCTFNSGDSGEQRSVWNKSLLCSPHLENRWPSLCWSEVQMEQACAATTHFFRRLRWSVAALKFCFVVSALGVYLQGKPRNIQTRARLCIGNEVQVLCVRRDQNVARTGLRFGSDADEAAQWNVRFCKGAQLHPQVLKQIKWIKEIKCSL